jgi:hypothetical protein
MRCQTACKPGSVRTVRSPWTARDGHSSGTRLTTRLTRPTRAAGWEHPRAPPSGLPPLTDAAAPIRSCSRWGLPCRPCCQGRGALLPHRFALARGSVPAFAGPLARAVCFLWHFPWGRPRRPLAGTVFPWSPDFPPSPGHPGNSGRPAVWRRQHCARPARAVKRASRRWPGDIMARPRRSSWPGHAAHHGLALRLIMAWPCGSCMIRQPNWHQ